MFQGLSFRESLGARYHLWGARSAPPWYSNELCVVVDSISFVPPLQFIIHMFYFLAVLANPHSTKKGD